MQIKLKEVGKHVNYYSTITSNYVLQFSMAGIVIVWFFLCQYQTKLLYLIFLLKLAFALFLLSLISSLIQYAYSTFIMEKFYHDEIEKTATKLNSQKLDVIIEEYVDENPKFEKISWFYYYLKIFLLLLGYVLVLIYISKLFIL